VLVVVVDEAADASEILLIMTELWTSQARRWGWGMGDGEWRTGNGGDF
jgi:hypothetical protein